MFFFRLVQSISYLYGVGYRWCSSVLGVSFLEREKSRFRFSCVQELIRIFVFKVFLKSYIWCVFEVLFQVFVEFGVFFFQFGDLCFIKVENFNLISMKGVEIFFELWDFCLCVSVILWGYIFFLFEGLFLKYCWMLCLLFRFGFWRELGLSSFFQGCCYSIGRGGFFS